MTDEIDHRFKNAWLRQLREDWHAANDNFFKSKMRLPQLGLSSGTRRLGGWQGGAIRCLSISGALIRSAPWDSVQEVLYHEMAHQFVEEVLGIKGEPPHGPAFKRVCLDRGLDAGATGDPADWVANRKKTARADTTRHKTMDKVNKLLALAQSANAHEAESAMNKAHTLLLKHNLSLLDLQSQSRFVHKQIGAVGRRNPAKSILGAILSRFFFVETIWTFGYNAHEDKRGRILEIYGTPENVEIAEYIHDTLQGISERLWGDYKRQQSICGDRHRRSFIYGLLNGFYAQLDRRRTENESKALVWRGDPRLRAFFNQRNPKRINAASRYSKSSAAAYRSGIAQGKTLIIHRGLHGKRGGAIARLN